MRAWGLAAIVPLMVAAAHRAHADVDDGLPPQPPPVVHHTAGPWIMFGAGATIFVAAAVEEFLANVGDSVGSVMCAPHCPLPPMTVAFQEIGWMGMGTGVSLVIGGLVWHFLEPAVPATVSVAPMVGPQTGGVTLRAVF